MQTSESKNTNENNDNNSNDKKSLFRFIVTAIIITMIINFFIPIYNVRSQQNITYSEFLQMITDRKVLDVNFVFPEKIVITEKGEKTSFSSQQKLYYTGYIDNPDIYKMLEENNVSYNRVVQNTSPFLSFITSWILPIFLIYGISSLFMRSMVKRMHGGAGSLSFGKNNAQIYAQKETGVTFKDVAGQEEAKDSLTEIVDFLHNPEKYSEIGAKLPKGALLVGPPGTGKTLLAKAVAGEGHVPFYSLSGSNFVEMFVGVGASRVRDLFKEAVSNAPCIVFIDEIDAIGKSRDGSANGNDEREQTLNQLLAEMDGFDASKGVVILGATNRPEVLDKALLRPGRFDRRVIVEKPDLKGRIDILNVHIKDVVVGDNVNIKGIALATSGCAGADLANIINEGALRAVSLGRSSVIQEDFLEAIEVIIAGKEKKDRILTDKEKEIVAYHEVGHALATAYQKNEQPVSKITIVPRTMGALGYTMQMPEEEKYLLSKEEMLKQIVTLLAGRAAEEIIFSSVTNGASNDIEKATSIARAMVTQFGMGAKFGMMGIESIKNKYLDGTKVFNCSDETATIVDEEISSILSTCYEKARTLLNSNLELLKKITAFLLEKETITGEEFMKLYSDSV